MSRTTTKIVIAHSDGTIMGQYVLGLGEHVIGREIYCAIFIDDPHVSRSHARLVITEEAIEIEDLEREVAKTATLDHTNILKIEGLIRTEDEPPFILMEYVAGPEMMAGTDLDEVRRQTPNRLMPWSGKTGVKLWEFETGGDVGSSPAIGSDGTLYVGSADRKLYAIKTDAKGLSKNPWPMTGQNPQHTGRAK